MCSSGSPSDSPTPPRRNLTSADVSAEVFAHVEKESSWILEQLHAAAAARIDDPAVAEVVAGQERLLNTELAAAFGALASMVDQVVAAAVGAGLATDQLAGLLQPLQQRQRMLRMLRAQGGRTSPTTAGCRPSARFSSSPGPTRFSTAGRESPWKKVRNSRAQIVGARADGADGGVDGRASRVSPAMAAFATAAIERAREQQREGGGSCSASLDAAGAACADPVNRASLARKMSAANGLLARRTSGATSSTEEVTTHAPPPLNEKRQSHFGASAKVDTR